MDYAYYVIPVLWLGWLLYWHFASRNVKPATRRESIGSRLSYQALLIIAVLLLWLPEIDAVFLFAPLIPKSRFTFWMGTAIVVLGFGFSIWARRVLGRNWSDQITLKKNHELVQTGPYRWMRHPIYTGLLLAVVGTAFALDEWRGIISCCLAFAAFILKLRIEESWMIELFGPAYLQYQRRTKILIPFIW